MATLKEVAKEVGVSTFTVSRVLSGQGRDARISEERIDEVMQAAKRLGYRTNAAARATREQRTRQAGVLTFTHVDASDFVPQNQMLVQGINRELEKHGYITSLIRLSDVWEAGKARHRAFVEQLVDGIVAINVLPTSLEKELETQFDNCVWVDTNVFRDGRCIRRDELAAGRLLVEHAAKVGYRRVLYLDDLDHQGHLEALRDYKHYSWLQRHEGAKQTAAEHGLEFAVQGCGYHWKPEYSAVGKEFASDCLVLAYTLAQARMAIRMACDNRLRVGEDFGLACCEATPELDADWPGLCHSTFDRFTMGEQAARMLVAQVDENLAKKRSGKVDAEPSWRTAEPQLLAPELFVGDTALGPKSLRR